MKIRIINETARFIAGCWLEYDGQAQLDNSPLPGDEVDYNSLLTHAWRILDVESRKATAASLANEPDQDFIIQ